MRYITTAALFLVGCAASPLAPPLVEDMPSGAREYRWYPMRWTPGRQLTYRVDQYSEVRTGERTATSGGSSEMMFAAQERTAKGWIRVVLTTHGRQLGSILFDSDGHIQDVMSDTPDFARTAQTLTPLAASIEGRTLSLGEPVEVDVPLQEAFSGTMPAEVAEATTKLRERLGRLSCTFSGYKRLASARVAAVRCDTLANRLDRPIEFGVQGGSLKLDTLNVDIITYHEVDDGYLVASFMVITMGGEQGGQHWVFRGTLRQLLEPAK
jgi:hypothetical protein